MRGRPTKGLLVLCTAALLCVAILSSCGTGTPRSSQSGTTATTIGPLVLSDAHDVTFSNVTFDGAGSGGADSSGVVYIGSNCYNLTFENCTIEPNRDGVGDGVKIVGGSDHDISFIGCHFLTQPRMGFECIGRTDSGYQRINVENCTFEVQGSEAISYDDDTGRAGGCTISDNLVKGGGATTLYPWTQGFEINRVTNMTVIGNTFFACRGDIWNFTGPVGDCGWVIENNVVDMSRRAAGVTPTGNAACVTAVNVYGGSFAGNRITSAAPGEGTAWLSGCHGMDWRTTTWRDARGAPYATPRQVDCSGNLF
jgi:hypothetical protein